MGYPLLFLIVGEGGLLRRGGQQNFQFQENGGVIIKWGGGEKNDEKSRNLTQNYANLDKLGGFWNILGSQKIFFIKWGGHNKRDLVVKNRIFGKYPPPLLLGTREYVSVKVSWDFEFFGNFYWNKRMVWRKCETFESRFVILSWLMRILCVWECCV